ncbi:Pls/PosA family non-ribosomal peptide synthetase, partial [Streptomyces sp. NPDC086787]|uniref:Pls/PosA family non-ribosomal peptide synthetase n=1 Tax=Streptomyces sp. NPDC086787 TaxID=3365759 RepID=UPI0037FE72D3
RKREDLPTVSMKDVYRHPTIRGLAAFTEHPAVDPPVPASPATSQSAMQASAESDDLSGVPDAPRCGPWRYALCGAAQLLAFLVYSSVAASVAVLGYEWTVEGSGPAGVYLRAVLFSTALFIGACALPIAAKWILIGRFRPARFPLWGFAYLRWWCVKILIRTSPIRLFTASPLYVLYLRALGARIGTGVTILARQMPVCTDLLSIGDGTVVRKDVLVSCYRAHDGCIETGPVTLGADVTVGVQAVLDINTSMDDHSQLGHASSLHPGQRIPAGESWHGTPARPTTTDFRTVEPAACGPLRRVFYSLSQLLAFLLVYLPLTLVGVSLVFMVVPQLNSAFTPGPQALTSPRFYLEALVASLVVFFGGIAAGLVAVSTIPRLLSLAVEPGRAYPLYGFHHGIQRAITRLTNVRFFTTLFGDSSAIVHYLRCLGYDLCRVEQTGSNFGALVRHDTPYLSTVGRGTMVADGLSIVNADFSSTSFRLSRTAIGPNNFIGNHIAYPAHGRTGENCLLATKVMVPIDGEVREGVGLLGSPSFEIPRTVLRDTQFEQISHGDEQHRRLAAKNRHNAITASLHLLSRWFHFFVLVLITMTAIELYDAIGIPAYALAGLLTLVFTVLYFTLIERAVTALRPLRPLYCSIYAPDFWGHERYWKLTSHDYVHIFNGTPFKTMIWRWRGAKIGRRVFDDGCVISERGLTTIGDGSTLNAGCIIQCHSQEDGAFKSDRVTIGADVTIGVGSLVHYGTTLGERAQLAAHSFLMKGEEIPPDARWEGNPAGEADTVRD